jgi:hypothetical protein
MSPFRIGMIVPISNTTMETEIPAMLRAREAVAPECTFHSSRMRMKHVTPDELRAVDAESERCAVEFAHADVSVAASIVGGYDRFDVLGLVLNGRPLEPLAEGRVPDEPQRGRSDRELLVGGE